METVFYLKMIKLSLEVKQSVVFSVILVKNINLVIDIVSNQDISLELLFITCLYTLYEILFCVYMMTSNIQNNNINLELFSLCGLVINSIILFTIYLSEYDLKEIKLFIINVLVYILFYFSFITLSRSLKFYKVTIKDLERYGNECVICLEEMSRKSCLQKLKCNHVFHKDCISKYVGYNMHVEELNCPTCRC